MTRTATKPTARRDLDAEITEKIIAAMEAGTAPWRSPYLARIGTPVSLSTKKAYRGVNNLLLALAGIEAGYSSPYWGTYKAISEAGGQVRKGEKGTLVVFWKRWDREVTNEAGEVERKGGALLRHYTVFNAEQADGLDAKYAAVVRPEGFSPVSEAEAIVSGYSGRPAIVSVRQDVAYYWPSTDEVNVPKPENIDGVHEYYSTLFHELGHSTGHAKRLNREGITSLGAHVRGEVYSFEELVAEFTAGILCAHAGITDTLDNSAAYLRHWADFLRSNPQAVIKASGAAQKAVDHILGTTFED